jgi:hypothetical protein
MPIHDNFLCYRVRRTRTAAPFTGVLGVTAVDQFESVTLAVAKPAMLCVPVNVDGANPGAETDPDAQLCYSVKRYLGPRFTPVYGAYVNNAFGPLRLDVLKSEQLCVPAQIP